ncbi:MAG: DUF4168 domain-containing protein [Desulfuromonadales bacterium]
MMNFAQKNRKSLFGILFAAALALTAVPAMAQPGYGSGDAAQEGAQQPAKQDFDEQTLDNFASASVELGKIQEEFSQKLEGVQDREKAMTLQREMNEKMVQVVQDKGIDVQTYNAVANQLGADPELKKKIDKMVEEKKAE